MSVKKVSHQDDEQMAQLHAQLEQAQTELAQAQDAQRRALADYQNLQRRTQEERSFVAKMATQNLVGDLLDHLDHLSMALEHNPDKGLEMIVSQLWATLKDHGLEELNVLNQPFNPETMEAVENTGESGVVTKIVQRGYSLNGIVLRVAKVVVG